MTINQIESLYTTLKIISEKELPIFTSYKIAKVLSQLESDYEFYTKKLRKIIEKYGEKDEEGNPIIENDHVRINPDFLKLAEDELAELNQIESDPLSFTFTLKELEDTGLKITPSQLQVLLPIIEE